MRTWKLRDRMWTMFWMGVAFDNAVLSWSQDRYGSLDAYVAHLQRTREDWLQVPVAVWIASGVVALLVARVCVRWTVRQVCPGEGG